METEINRLLAESNAKMDKIILLNEELLKWTRFDKKMKLKEFIQSTLTTDNEKIIYELTDGEMSTRDIEAKCKINQKTVSTYWQKWQTMGILERTEKYSGKRYRKICSLKELGIDIPQSKELIATEPKAQENQSDIKEDTAPSNIKE